MCTRYTLRRPTLSGIGRDLGAEVMVEDEVRYEPRDSIVPGSLAWILTAAGDRRVLGPARWNYITRAKRSLSNISSEVIRFGRFRDEFATRRCVIVADGFYAWPEASDRPLWYRSPGADLVLMGGLFQPPRVIGAPARFSVLTVRSRSTASRPDDRLPVVVDIPELDRWLNADFASALAMLSDADGRQIVGTEV
jgi:putative SOS response-associated peptidase YedK